jgi:hypothetical protein
MGQVQHIEASETVAAIIEHEVSPAQVAKARAFVESFMFTTSALIALEAAVRELYGEADADAAPVADLIGSIVRSAAELEAVEV